ncbi:MAG: hypothetical protein ACLR78_05795 [Roseburia sp.]
MTGQTREIELEERKRLRTRRTEIVSIASLMAEKAVAASMDVKIQDSLIEETLKEMGESTPPELVSKVCGDALFEAAMERDMLSPVMPINAHDHADDPHGEFSQDLLYNFLSAITQTRMEQRSQRLVGKYL